MIIYDFITQDELDDLPDDSQQAFLQFVNHAQRRFSAIRSELSAEDDWDQLQDARHTFQNIVLGAAKRYQIEPLSNLQVPRRTSYHADEFREFQAELDHYVTQIVIGNSMQRRRESVYLSSQAKDRIRVHLGASRDSIEKSHLSDSKKDALQKRLDEFEAALNRERISFVLVASIALTILSAPGGVSSSIELVAPLWTKVLKIIGEAKAVEDESRQLPPSIPIPALSPPRSNEIIHASAAGAPDDDIPF